MIGYEMRRVSPADMKFTQLSRRQMIIGTSLIVLTGFGMVLWMDVSLTSTLDTLAIRQACGADIKTYCSGVQPGSDRILICLQRNVSRLSDGCQDVLQALAPARVAKS